jgi:B9 domain-containing protein 1
VRLFKPRSASLLQTLTGWITGMPAEFIDPRFPAYSEGREGEWIALECSG